MKFFYAFLAVVAATETTVATTTETTLANVNETTAAPASTVSVEYGYDDYNMSHYMPMNMTTSSLVCAQASYAKLCSTSQVRDGNLCLNCVSCRIFVTTSCHEKLRTF